MDPSFHQHFHRGEWVVHARHEWGFSPPKGATGVRPAAKGDTTCWTVEELGVVIEARPDGLLLVRTCAGEQRFLSCNDPRLRRPSVLQRLRGLLRLHRLRVAT